MPEQKQWLEQERAPLEDILSDYESGKVTHYAEDDAGKSDVTAQRIESIRERLAHVCRKISEFGRR